MQFLCTGTLVLPCFTVSYFSDVVFFYKMRQDPPPGKRLNSLYLNTSIFGGLDLNLHCLWGLPVFLCGKTPWKSCPDLLSLTTLLPIYLTALFHYNLWSHCSTHSSVFSSLPDQEGASLTVNHSPLLETLGSLVSRMSPHSLAFTSCSSDFWAGSSFIPDTLILQWPRAQFLVLSLSSLLGDVIWSYGFQFYPL